MSDATLEDGRRPVSDATLEDAVAWIAAGGLLAYPTETVWGLAADARSETAIEQLRAFKGRGDDAPLSILVTGFDALAPLGLRVGTPVRRLAERFWPGPLTLVVAGGGGFAPGVARADGAVGVRCSPHAVAEALAKGCARAGTGPVTATSCNQSGAVPARTRADARAVCAGDARVRVLASDPDAGGEAASTVVDVTGPQPRVLRWGSLRERELAPILEECAA